MNDQRKQRSIRNILILPGFQGKMILFVILSGFVCTALNGVLYYYYVADSYDFILRHSSLPKELISDRYRDLFNFGVALGIATLLIVIVVAIWTLFLTHRSAGAIYHIKRVIGDIRSGNVSARVHLRPKDEFQDVAQAFNQMMDELQKK